MSLPDRTSEALEGLRQCVESGRIAHAYLVVGSPRGEGLVLARKFLQLLFCTESNKPCGACPACVRVESRTHPDVHWLEPKSKGRFIMVEPLRELINSLSQTSFIEEGWKASVLLFADRMNEAAQNAFLKTLEEPLGKSVILLVTEEPQALLPTILSRCQRVGVAEGQSALAAPWHEALLEMLRANGRPDNAIQAFSLSSQLVALLKQIKESIEAEEDVNEESSEPAESDEEVEDKVYDARIRAKVLEAQTALLQRYYLWKRDVLMLCLGASPELIHFQGELSCLREQAAGQNVRQALSDLTALEEMARRFKRHLPDEVVFEAGLLKTLPA